MRNPLERSELIRVHILEGESCADASVSVGDRFIEFFFYHPGPIARTDFLFCLRRGVSGAVGAGQAAAAEESSPRRRPE